MDSTKINEIFSINSEAKFFDLCLKVFRFQYENNKVYREFVDYIRPNLHFIEKVEDIPFLPIEFFKSKRVVSGDFKENATFKSSGTTGQNSHHFVRDLDLYSQSYWNGINFLYPYSKNWAILGLLPNYLEQGNSSLVYMVDGLIKQSTVKDSGFYLHNFQELQQTLLKLKEQKTPTLLIGVGYALLDFADEFPIQFPGLMLMETGGMKGRKKEMTRGELHQLLQQGFGVEVVHSEYGMTELLSQAYSNGHGIFQTPPWMRILIREKDDPLGRFITHRSGIIHVIDLANVHSCSFIATQDYGRQTQKGFEVLGRVDNSDARGCALMLV